MNNRKLPINQTIHQLFEIQVGLTPDAIAVMQEHQQISYETLNQKANQLAHYLQKSGIKPESLVGLCVERSLEMVIALLGILKAGGAYVPLDPQYPQERLDYMILDAQVSVIITQSHLVDKLGSGTAKIICLGENGSEIAQESVENPNIEVQPENLAYVIYTSGSTGKPKGVMIEHRSVVNFIEAVKIVEKISHSDRVLQFASINFDVAVDEIYSCLIFGATVVLRTEEMLSSFSTFMQKCREWQLTVLDLPTAFWQALITELDRTQEMFPESVQLIVIGGESFLPEKLKQWQRYTQEISQSYQQWQPPRLINAYGPTETTVEATVCDLTTYNLLENSTSVPIGRPLSNTQIYILNGELKPETPGELYIGGMSLARGYLNRPDLTAEKFILNPFNPSERLYKTGDLGRYLEDGNIEFLGRIDTQIKIRGFRVELGEIESILGEHSGVGEAVVIPIPDNFGNQQLVAYIVPQFVDSKERVRKIIPQLREFLQEKLPEYMIPSAFRILDRLPLTPNGKVDRQALAALPLGELSLAKTYAAPRTPEEEMIADLWAQILEVETVGIEDNFFELGGDSLKIMVLANRLQQQLGKNFSMVELFNFPTIAELASRLHRKPFLPETIQNIAISSHQEIRYFPPSFLQERFWNYRQLGSFYHLPNYFHLQGNLNITVLEKSFNEIIRRHEILRTKLQEINGSLMQVVAVTEQVNLLVIELLNLPESEQMPAVELLINQEKQRFVKLDQDPWLRVIIFRLSEQSHILVIGLHYLIADERSTEILLKELGIFYEAFCLGKPHHQPELPLQYGDYAIAQRQSLTEDVLQTRRNYWQKWLNQEPAALTFPSDKPLLDVPTLQAETRETQLSVNLSTQLKILSQEQQVTLFTTLAAAWGCLLSNYSGCESLVIGVPMTERNNLQFNSVIGDFGKMGSLKIDLSGNPSFLTLLERVREEILAMMTYQDVPFEQVKNTLQPPVKRDRPFFRVYLDYLLETPKTGLELSGLSVTDLPIKGSMARLDLGLIVWTENQSLRQSSGQSLRQSSGQAWGANLNLWWRYKKDLFEAKTIAEMEANFEKLLEAIVTSPDSV